MLLDRLSVLRQIASVLTIPLAVLIDPEEAERQRTCPDDREIEAIRHALRRYDAITNVFRPDGDVLPEPNLAKLEHAVRFGWMAFQASNYQAVGQLLADLIRDAQAAVWQLDNDERRQAQTWLAWTYQLTASTAFKLGNAQLGRVAADRGIQIAEQTGDLTLIGGAARRVGHALMATHHSGDAVELMKSAANRLEPQLRGAAPAFVSAYGMLLLKGSIAAARIDQAAGDLMGLPRERRVSHLLDAIVVGGASFNTINKWAAGISDTLVLGLLNEAIGLDLPLAALPFLNAAQAVHPAFGRSVKELRAAGVAVLLGPDGYEPHVKHQGSKYLSVYPWHVLLAAVETS